VLKQDPRLDDGRKLDEIRAQTRGQALGVRRAKLIAALAAMKSLDSLFEATSKKTFVDALLDPKNEAKDALTIARIVYIDAIDLDAAPAPQPTPPPASPSEPDFPPLPSGPIPATAQELVAYVESNPSAKEIPAMLQALDRGPLGAELREVSKALQSMMSDGSDLAAQMQFGQQVETLLQQAREQLAKDATIATVVAAMEKTSPLGATLSKSLTDATKVDIFWAVVRLGNVFIASVTP